MKLASEMEAIGCICSWCNEVMDEGELLSQSYDGEWMHFGCACEADDPEPYIPD